MIRSTILAVALVVVVGTPAFAAPCRDAKGKFTKCPPAAAAPAVPTRCKDAKGKFMKCSATTTIKTTKTSTTTTTAGAH